ncbi:YopX family protein [Brevibacillus centrosporus]|uniref:YopX family protein n=1 Tax=Brevibacillus centrosporus TaxID=54910 RepID=UPI002E1D3147|nr:YopX family protein [Brevibacillus centrosporus]
MQAGREVKYQAWILPTNEMKVVTSLRFDENGKLFGITTPDTQPGGCIILKSVRLRQFTGLCDKNGKEIYEGDILKQMYRAESGSYDDRISHEGHHVGPVVITASKGVCMKNPLCYSVETDETSRSKQYKNVASYRCEVIGNIYENPELLKAI